MRALVSGHHLQMGMRSYFGAIRPELAKIFEERDGLRVCRRARSPNRKAIGHPQFTSETDTADLVSPLPHLTRII